MCVEKETFSNFVLSVVKEI